MPIDLAGQSSRVATFARDGMSGVLRWLPNAHDVLGCVADEVENRLGELISAGHDAGRDVDIVPTVDASTTGPGVRDRPSWSTACCASPARSVAASDGGERSLLVGSHVRLHDGDGRVGDLHGAVVDLTGERRAERELVDLIDRYRLLVELSPDAIVVHEAGLVRYANSAAGRLARTTPKAMLGRSIVDFIHPDDLDGTLARILALTEPGMYTEATTIRLVAEDGDPFLIEAVSVRTTWEGRPAFQVVMRDVAEREAAKAALRAQARLVESVSDAIMATDDRRIVTSWNPAAELLFGWTADEVIGRPFIDLGVPSAYVLERRAEVLAGKQWSGQLDADRGSPRAEERSGRGAVLRPRSLQGRERQPRSSRR